MLALFGRLGWVVNVPDELAPVAAALTSVGPAYMALVAEAQTDAGVRHGLRADLAAPACRRDDGRLGRAARRSFVRHARRAT